MNAAAPRIEAEADLEDLARECLYRFLSVVVNGPYSRGWDQVVNLDNQQLALEAAALLRWESDPEPLDFVELVEQLRKAPEVLREEYDRAFGLVVPKECPPYETEFDPSGEPFARSQQMADVAGFYRAFGIMPSQQAPERPDHLALELEFMAFVLLKQRMARAVIDENPDAAEQARICEQAHRQFFRDHLAWWVPSFASGLRRKARSGYNEALARVLAAWVPAECRRLNIEAVLRPFQPSSIEPPEESSGCATCPMHG